jgi:hypothetical protein
MRIEFRRWTRLWQKTDSQQYAALFRKYLKKTLTDAEMKFYKLVVRPTLLYGSEMWVTTKRDMTHLEAAEMRFLRSVKGQNKKKSHKKRTREHKTWDPNTNKTGSTVSKEWTTPDCRNTASTTNLEEEEIVDAPRNDGNALLPEQVKRPNAWRRRKKKMMMIMMMGSRDDTDNSLRQPNAKWNPG